MTPQAARFLKLAGARTKYLAKAVLGLQGRDAHLASKDMAQRLGSGDSQGVHQQLLASLEAQRPGTFVNPTAGRLKTLTERRSLRPVTSDIYETLGVTPNSNRANVPGKRIYERFKTMLGQSADQTAMSGRHGDQRTPVSLTADPNTIGSKPQTAYKGFWANESGHPTVERVKPGDPTWWSGYPDVAGGYASRGTTGYVAEAPVSTLQTHGAYGPFTHHIAHDNRASGGISRWMWKQLSKRMPNAGAGDWGERPAYEGVFTAPPVGGDVMNYASKLHKALPSGTGFQTVYQDKTGSATPMLAVLARQAAQCRLYRLSMAGQGIIEM